MQNVDLIINARWVIPVEPKLVLRDNHSIVINNGEIIALAPQTETANHYQGQEIVHLPDHAVIPGLINTHTHAAMNLFRGFADDLPLNRWLNERIWPAEATWVDEAFIRAGTELALAEMMRGGVTCFNDMYFFPDITAKCCELAGMRASVGLIMLDFPTRWAQGPDEYLDKALRLHDELRHSSLLQCAFAPHAPYTVSDQPLTKIRTFADELDIPIHMHVHETAHEIEESMSRYGVRPLERLSQLGLLTPKLQAVHMTQLLEAEIQAIALAGINVVHCPESNLKLASGFCPLAKLQNAKINVALGTDSAASNNNLDILGEMRSAALLAKQTIDDAAAVSANSALAMATINGARAMGIEHQVGSIEIGKRADLCAFNLNDIRTQPLYDPITQIVYSADRDQVSDVWIDGKSVVRQGELQTLDTEVLISNARYWGEKISD